MGASTIAHLLLQARRETQTAEEEEEAYHCSPSLSQSLSLNQSLSLSQFLSLSRSLNRSLSRPLSRPLSLSHSPNRMQGIVSQLVPAIMQQHVHLLQQIVSYTAPSASVFQGQAVC